MSDEHARCNTEIRRLATAVESLTRSGIDNAARYSTDIEAERRAGALRVDRIRSAILDGAADSAQRVALAAALCVVEGATLPRDLVAPVCAALLACNDALREERAEVVRVSDVLREMVAP